MRPKRADHLSTTSWSCWRGVLLTYCPSPRPAAPAVQEVGVTLLAAVEPLEENVTALKSLTGGPGMRVHGWSYRGLRQQELPWGGWLRGLAGQAGGPRGSE